MITSIIKGRSPADYNTISESIIRRNTPQAIPTYRVLGRLPDQAVVFCVGADPEPDEPVRSADGKRAIMLTDASRPEASHSLQMQRWMPRVGFQSLKAAVGQALDGIRQSCVCGPKFRVGIMVQSLVERPVACAARARSARESSLPAATSRSICRSQASASNAANQRAKIGEFALREARDQLFGLVNLAHSSRILSVA